MDRSRLLLAFVAALAVSGVGTAQPAASQPGTSEPTVVKGFCSYSDQLAPLLEQNHFFAECDRLELRRVGGQVDATFAFPARLQSLELRGTFAKPGQLEISAMRLRSRRDWEEAEGQCDFTPRGEDYATVTCFVRNGPFFFGVSFAREF